MRWDETSEGVGGMGWHVKRLACGWNTSCNNLSGTAESGNSKISNKDETRGLLFFFLQVAKKGGKKKPTEILSTWGIMILLCVCFWVILLVYALIQHVWSHDLTMTWVWCSTLLLKGVLIKHTEPLSCYNKGTLEGKKNIGNGSSMHAPVNLAGVSTSNKYLCY